MIAFASISVALAFVVLAAHFWRAGDLVLAVVALACIALLFVRRAWAARAMQVALLMGAIEWLRTLAALVAMRQSQGAPYLRLAAILGIVAVLTAAGALAFRPAAMRARFRLPP